MVAPLLFVAFPITELLLLILAGSTIGFWPTVGWILGTMLLGIWLVRREGLAAVRKAQAQRRLDGVPIAEVMTSVRFALAGILLIIPGFLSDIAGLLLLVPATSSRVITTIDRGSGLRFGTRHPPRYPAEKTIDADYEVVEREPSERDVRPNEGDQVKPSGLPAEGQAGRNE